MHMTGDERRGQGSEGCMGRLDGEMRSLMGGNRYQNIQASSRRTLLCFQRYIDILVFTDILSS